MPVGYRLACPNCPFPLAVARFYNEDYRDFHAALLRRASKSKHAGSEEKDAQVRKCLCSVFFYEEMCPAWHFENELSSCAGILPF